MEDAYRAYWKVRPIGRLWYLALLVPILLLNLLAEAIVQSQWLAAILFIAVGVFGHVNVRRSRAVDLDVKASKMLWVVILPPIVFPLGAFMASFLKAGHWPGSETFLVIQAIAGMVLFGSNLALLFWPGALYRKAQAPKATATEPPPLPV